ncbi:MAG: hypothetical protein GY708_13005 [Actinomycetia bacterium]|nr:hypothetical protein [Actinomycetes bacterium]
MRFAVVIASIALGGVAIGVAVERSGLYSPIGEPLRVAAMYEVPFYACPGDDTVGALHGGDRVYITGKSADEQLLAVRAPNDVDQTVWVEARHVVADAALDSLPVTACADRMPTEPSTAGEGSGGQQEDETAATPTMSPPPVTEPTPTPSPTNDVPPPTSVLPPSDEEGPLITLFQANRDGVWEDAIYGGCATEAHVAKVGAAVSDPSGVLSVWIDWSVGTSTGTVAATEIADSVYSAEIGPFPDTTLTAGTAAIELQIAAYDTYSNETIASSSDLIVLHDCAIR